MKLRIIEAGWATFTGDLGAFEFVNGVSVEDIGKADSAYLAGIVSIEDAETGENPSLSQHIVDSMDNKAAVEAVVETVKPAEVGAKHTKQSLEAVADRLGIKGLREFSDPMGIKGNSIVELIEKIISAQAQ